MIQSVLSSQMTGSRTPGREEETQRREGKENGEEELQRREVKGAESTEDMGKSVLSDYTAQQPLVYLTRQHSKH